MTVTAPSIVLGRGGAIKESEFWSALLDQLTSILQAAPDEWSLVFGSGIALRFVKQTVKLKYDPRRVWPATGIQPIDLGMTSCTIVDADYRPSVIDCSPRPDVVLTALRRLVHEPALKGLVIRFDGPRFDFWRSQGLIHTTIVTDAR